MKILLTGASGFLGAALAHGLVDQGHEVALLMRPTSSTHRLGQDAGRFRIGACAGEQEIRAFVRSHAAEVVMHTACAYGRAGETALELADVNTRYGMVVLDAALSASQGRLQFINTGTALAADVSPYALSKHHFSQWGQTLASQPASRLRFINVALHHMYGAGDDKTKFATYVMHACHDNQPELALTAGEQLRDFIYIDDVVSAYLALMRHAEELPAYADIEVGSGHAPTIRHFVETIHRLTRSTTRLAFGAVAYRPNEAMLCKANVQGMKALGWEPRFDIDAGLAKMIATEFAA